MKTIKEVENLTDLLTLQMQSVEYTEDYAEVYCERFVYRGRVRDFCIIALREYDEWIGFLHMYYKQYGIYIDQIYVGQLPDDKIFALEALLEGQE